MACWSIKVAISLKRVKIGEKLLRRAYRNSPTLFWTVPPPTPYGYLFPKIEVHNPNPKLQSLLSQERVKLRTANLADTFTRSIRTIRPLQIWEKEERWRIQGLPNFLEYPLLSQEWVKLRTEGGIGSDQRQVVRLSVTLRCDDYIGCGLQHYESSPKGAPRKNLATIEGGMQKSGFWSRPTKPVISETRQNTAKVRPTIDCLSQVTHDL